MQPTLAVIIPTQNRRDLLLHMLDALARQTYPADRFEVIVICDGCQDDTYATLQTLATPFRLRAFAQLSAGPAAARNRGAEETDAPVVLFIDDDIIAVPNLFHEHMRLHHEGSGRVVIGRLLPDPDVTLNGWNRWEQRTWDRRYDALACGAVPVGGQHFFSGNVSVDRATFLSAGGFNAALKRAEDTELGYRLQKAGATFCFNDSAAGVHCGAHSFEKWQRIQYIYGRSDVWLADHVGHADMIALDQGFRERNLLNRMLLRLAVGRPAIQGLVLPMARACARVGDNAGTNRISHWSYSVLANVAYWQGVADELGSARALWQRLRHDHPPRRSAVHA